MMTISRLDNIRAESISKLKIRKNSDGRKIVIGMGECGLKAGARDVMQSILNDFSAGKVDDVSVILCDCEGKCDLEPVVHFYDKDGSKTTFTNVTPAIAKEIVSEYIIKGNTSDKKVVFQNVG